MFAPSLVAELGLPEGETWPSENHKVLAQRILGFNERVNTLEDLQKFCSFICEYTEPQLRELTVEELMGRGFPV